MACENENLRGPVYVTPPCFLVTPMLSRRFLLRLMGLAAALLVAAGAYAQTTSPGEGLLPVTQAFALKPVIDKPGTVALHFDIAAHYYLYRDRIHAKVSTPGITAGALQTPPGTREHRSEEHTSELQSPVHLVCRLLLEKKKNNKKKKNSSSTLYEYIQIHHALS